MEFSELSLTLTEKLTKETKKNEGIFFTPPNVVTEIVKYLKGLIKSEIIDILEPSCGSGEILNGVLDTFPNSSITGIEKNKFIYETIVSDEKLKRVKFINEDFMTFNGSGYDLIIGNPPYFVISKDMYEEYSSYSSGRPNIFVTFTLHSLKKLNEGGILAFVIPNSFFNCSYYKLARKYIYHNFKILDIVDYGDAGFIETAQKTNVIYIQKSSGENNNDDYCLLLEDYYIFNMKSNITKMKGIIKKTTTLEEIGFNVFNGNFVWNQEKDCLTNDFTKARVIYSRDITENKLSILDEKSVKDKWISFEDKLKGDPNSKKAMDDISKKHFVDIDKLFRKHTLPKLVKELEKVMIEEEKLKSLTGKGLEKGQEKISKMKAKEIERKKGQEDLLLVINRGYGNSDYKLNYAIVDIEDEYYLENHVLGIKFNSEITKDKLLKHYEKIIESFKSKETLEFLELCMGNNAINTTELQKILPIKI